MSKCWFFIGLRAHVRSICCKQGWVDRKPVNANPGLNVNQDINFSCKQYSFFSLYILRFSILLYILSSKHRPAEQYTESLTAKLQNSAKIVAYPGFSNLASARRKSPATSSICAGYFSYSIQYLPAYKNLYLRTC